MEEKIILERHKKRDYTVWFDKKKYFWASAKGNIVSKVNVPREVYDYLAMSTNCFKNGELILAKATSPELTEELVDEIFEREQQEANSLTREEVEKILKGTVKAMEEELSKITSDTTKTFVLDVAKEIKMSNANKQKFIRDWIGTEISIEDLFEVDAE